MQAIQFFALAVGGSLGVWLRFFISTHWLKAENFSAFPVGTLTVNILGSFLFGLGYAYFDVSKGTGVGVAQMWQVAFLVGFCGALTTFSSFAFDVIRLLEQGMAAKSVAYLLLNIVGAIFALFIGLKCLGFK